MLPAVAFTVVAVCVLLLGEHRQDLRLRQVSKTLASLGFIAVALLAGALDGGDWGLAVLVALVLSLVGDVALLGESKRAFLGGLVAFLLGHVAYAVGLRGLMGPSPDWTMTGIGALVTVVIGAVILRWLMPQVPKKLKGPVVAYIVVISVMVTLAVGAAVERDSALLLVAAVAFFLSDIAVARNRFAERGFVNKAVGLPLYYGAQLLFASTAGLYG